MDNYVFYFHAGSKNHGCEAIVRSSCKIIDEKNKVVLYSSNPNEDFLYGIDNVCNVAHFSVSTEKKYSLEHIMAAFYNKAFNNSNYYYRKFLSTIGKDMLTFSIGGDNYCYGKNIYNSLAYLNKNAKRRGAKTVLWGCSIEPDIMQGSVLEDLKRYDLITTRESITYNALIQKGVSQNTHLFPDPAFLLDKVELPLPNGFVEGNTVGLNVSPLIQSLEKGSNITYKNYSSLMKHIINSTDMQIALIPHVVKVGNNDLEPLTQLYNEYKETGRVVLVQDYNCMELKGFIARCRMFIGARTHATIAAYSTYVPTLVVGYSVKALGIARDIFGSEKDMVIPVQSLQKEDDLIRAFEVIKERESELRAHLQSFMPSYVKKAWAAGEEVKKLGLRI